jgi:hypothetical protein
MSSSPWFDDLPVLGALLPEETIAKLREVGEDDTADALEEAVQERQPSAVFGLKGWFSASDKPYLHTAHAFGYIPPNQSASEVLPILSVNSLQADPSLRHARLLITLGLLRVADYPGKGMHQILLHFAAQNHVPGMTEEVNFNATYRVRDGEHAAVRGYPIFVGLGVGGTGITFRCRTVLVKNERDEAFLSFLKSGVFKTGLRLATVAQPALAPLSAMAYGLAETIAGFHQNVSVQDFALGFDFSTTPAGVRLAEGAYLAVQIPDMLWEWDEWVYHPASGQVVKRANPKEILGYNYLLFNVSRYEEA